MAGIRDRYEHDTAVILRTLEAHGIDLFSETGLQGLRDHLVNDEQVGQRGRRFRYAPRSANRILAAAKYRMRQVLDSDVRLTIGQQFRGEKIIKSVRGVKTAAGLDSRKLLSADEVRALVAGCPEGLALIVRFLASTGCRIGEAVGIHLGDVSHAGDICYIDVIGKGTKARTVNCRRELAEEILAHFRGTSYLFEHNGKPYNSIYITQRIGVVALRTIGRSGISAHCLRHTYATLQYQARGRIEELAGYLGHSSSATTSAYYVHTRMKPEDAVAVAF
jgi:integrase